MMTRMNKRILMDRAMLLRLWDEAWNEGLWAAPWSRALEGLSPEQAVWRPQPDRHCIWQYVTHMPFWRDVTLLRLRGESILDDERKQRNFEAPPQPTEASLNALRSRWEQSHRDIRAALDDESHPADRLQYIAFHDSYHVGQIMLLRAMQGMPPIE